MLDQQETLAQYGTENLIADFLRAMFNGRCSGSDREILLARILPEHIHCSGFPEFNPKTRVEFSGFVNYLQDVFEQAEFSFELLLADDKTAIVRIHVRGNHHEEFMGLPASGGLLTFSFSIRFILHKNQIHEAWMDDKKVTLTTPKGVYQLKEPG